MKITNYLETAKILHEEILKDNNTWFNPVEKYGIFKEGYQKFLTRNYNYYNYMNMVMCLREQEELNNNFSKCYEFCESIRSNRDYAGPFGRMCVWLLNSGTHIYRHLDDFSYHKSIHRNIFIVSNHNTDVEILIDDKRVNVKQGDLFEFAPAYQFHSFTNNSKTDFYFLGFDFWNLKIYNAVSSLKTIKLSNNRLSEYGGGDFKYLSEH